MEDRIQLLEVVALTVDLPEHKLLRGQVGTVVEILGNGKALEVEFSDRDGRTYASLGLRPDQVMVLRYAPETATSTSGIK
ncbi:MAG TPA: DUF4926 domain-containing protein [Thermoanaerobaculia bacterium]